MTFEIGVEGQLRELAPQVLGALARRFGHFDLCEDAVQEALLAASIQWRDQGVPDNPRGWLITVASRRLTDQFRSDEARQRREASAAAFEPELSTALDPGKDPMGDEDDTLTLIYLCCHPALSAASQLALTLRAVGGLTTAEIARAFLVPESTMAQRISRAKASIREAGARFRMPPPEERPERLRVVLQVLYLVFNEGYTATSGPDLHRRELTTEAIRLTRDLHRLIPDDGEVTGLLALMLLTDARHDARTDPAGSLVPLADQDRTRWNAEFVREGVALIAGTLDHAPLGPYQLQAAIAAIHDEAPSPEATDWRQILALYELLERFGPNPMVTLNHAVAMAMVRGPEAGLAMLARLDDDTRMASHHRLAAVRAHLLELAGDTDDARTTYRVAARLTASVPERRYLESRAARLAATAPTDESARTIRSNG
ncbi:MAG TPA: DUF6596 domain-containing protein [Candidatus Limnocylindrales bacterium]